MRVRDYRYREPSLGSLERDIAGFAGGFAGTEDQFRDLESFQWARDLTQEVFMNWNQIEASWKQIKDKVVFHRERLRPDDHNGVDLIGPAALRESQSIDRQTTPLRADDRVRRSEFSLHIGC
jgi:hypothetical protein